MTFDLHYNARPDERFHLQPFQPEVKSHWDWWILRRTSWTKIHNEDRTPGRFISWWLCRRIQWYHGTVKCDGTRTRMGWNGELGEPRPLGHQYVMTTTPKELLALRWRSNGPGEPTWDGMGGS
jgi:hypothetical protein